MWWLYRLRNVPAKASHNYHTTAAASFGPVICTGFLLVHDPAARATLVLHRGLVHTGRRQVAVRSPPPAPLMARVHMPGPLSV